MVRRTPPVHIQKFSLGKEGGEFYLPTPPKHRNTRKSPSLFSYLWNSLPTLPRAKDLDETISFAQVPGEIYDAIKYCCTSVYNFFEKNLENTKDTVIRKNQSWQDRVLSRSSAQDRRTGNSGRKSRPGDWKSKRLSSDCYQR